LLYLVVADRLEHDESIAGAVGTLMTNMAVERAFGVLDVDFMRTKVGDRYVLEELSRRGWTFGGEGSGHLLILDRHSTGDGLVNALQILQACVRTGRTLSQWLLPVQLYPRHCSMCTGRQTGIGAAMPCWHEAQVEAELGSTGRVLVRHSGTEPLLHVMVEAQDGDQASRCAERLVTAARDG
jgi:phosphoglucosamine mutase